MALNTADQARLASLIQQSDTIKARISAYKQLSSPTRAQVLQKNLDVRSLDTVVAEIFTLRANENPAGAAFIGTLAVGGTISPLSVAAATTVAAAVSGQSILAPPAVAKPTSEVKHTEAKSSAKSALADTAKPPLVNPLHDYPSYTYGLSLAMLTVKEYNDLVEDTKTYVPERVIIASAGRYNGTGGTKATPGTPGNFKRAAYFNEDFYFENLNMTTIVGYNDHSRASNAINFTFTIIEPHGITLLNRILKLSAEIGSMNYIAQPYLLQIDFFGMNNAGEIVGVIPDQTKRMPIRILKMDIKASPKGAEYVMTASPYSHSAFDLGTVSTPALFEVTAGNIASFFQSNEAESELLAQMQSQRETQTTATQRASGLYSQAPNPLISSNRLPASSVSASSQPKANIVAALTSDPLYKVKSYGGAINAWFDTIASKSNDTVADKYYFKFHDDILEYSKFNIDAETLSTAHTAMASEENGMTIRGPNGAGMTLDYTVRTFAINAGTSIDQIITQAMRHTDYLQRQLRLASSFASVEAYNTYLKEEGETPLKWFKIIPTIKLGAYNISRETWSREITYNIIPHTVYNTKISEAPRGIIKDPCKVHNYWYTGKNNDVLDFNLEFNALYYTAVTAYRETISKLYNINEEPTKNFEIDAEVKKANAVMPQTEKEIVFNAQQRATGGDITTLASALADVEASLYTGAGGDMLQARLKIIGDPQYIKQDDIFYKPSLTTESTQVDTTGFDSRLIANGSLHMDRGELYVQITIRSPVDLDETTGLMKFDSAYETSLFSGMYRILKIENTFQAGKFEQVLDIVRLPRQTALDYTSKTKEKSAARDKVAVATQLANADSTVAKSPTKPIDNDKAPGSNPTTDAAAPVQTAEEKALANVDKTAPETPIDKPTEPVAVPPPSAANNKINEDINWNNSLIAQLETKLATWQAASDSDPLKTQRLLEIKSMIADYELKNRMLQAKLT